MRHNERKTKMNTEKRVRVDVTWSDRFFNSPAIEAWDVEDERSVFGCAEKFIELEPSCPYDIHDLANDFLARV